MTPTKDQQAQEYAEKIVKERWPKSTYPMKYNKRVMKFDGYDMEQAFEDGYTACEQSMWRSVEEELPEETRLVLAAFKLDGYRTARMAIYSHDYERWISFPGTCTLSNVDFWMPIPELSSLPDTNTEKR